MEVLKGRLIFSGLWLTRPWALIQPDGSTIDLYPAVHEFLAGAAGQKLAHEESLSSYELRFDAESPLELDYQPDRLVLLWGEKSASNVSAYIENVLTRFSGRLVEVVIDEKGLKVLADPEERVHVVRLADDNTAKVSESEAEAVCGFGTGHEACIFLAIGEKGFHCWKFESLFARDMLHRLSHGKTVSQKVGACALEPIKNSVA